MHTCPECGLDYDPHATVIRLQTRRRDYRQIVYGLVLLGMLYFASRRTGILQDDYPLILMIAAGMLAAFYRLSSSAGQLHLLILNRHGVRLEDRMFGRDTILWTALAKAKYGWLSGKFYLLGNNGARLLTCRANQLGTPRTVRRCVAEINRLLCVYSGDDRVRN